MLSLIIKQIIFATNVITFIQVDNLKGVCEKAIVKHFRKDNIFEILILADRFNAKKLKVENPPLITNL